MHAHTSTHYSVLLFSKSIPVVLFNATSILNCTNWISHIYKVTIRILAFLGGCPVALLKAVAIQSAKDACYEQMELYNGNEVTVHLLIMNKIASLSRKVYIMPA